MRALMVVATSLLLSTIRPDELKSSPCHNDKALSLSHYASSSSITSSLSEIIDEYN